MLKLGMADVEVVKLVIQSLNMGLNRVKTKLGGVKIVGYRIGENQIRIDFVKEK